MIPITSSSRLILPGLFSVSSLVSFSIVYLPRPWINSTAVKQPTKLLIMIAFWKKANLIFLFFLLRKLILPFYSFTPFCIILPMTMFVPEAELSAWLVCYIPAIMSCHKVQCDDLWSIPARQRL